MKLPNNLQHNFTTIYLSFFYVGFAPKAPGTFGSVATLPLIYLLSIFKLNLLFLVSAIIIVTICTCVLTEKLQKQLHLHDPQWIVIDEVLGMLTTWLFIYPSFTLSDAIAILVLFRFFDIIKIWPASFFDRLHHGSGTILDDIISGIYAGILLFIGKFCLFL